jgi:hypothetical protein
MKKCVGGSRAVVQAGKVYQYPNLLDKSVCVIGKKVVMGT